MRLNLYPLAGSLRLTLDPDSGGMRLVKISKEFPLTPFGLDDVERIAYGQVVGLLNRHLDEVNARLEIVEATLPPVSPMYMSWSPGTIRADGEIVANPTLASFQDRGEVRSEDPGNPILYPAPRVGDADLGASHVYTAWVADTDVRPQGPLGTGDNYSDNIRGRRSTFNVPVPADRPALTDQFVIWLPEALTLDSIGTLLPDMDAPVDFPIALYGGHAGAPGRYWKTNVAPTEAEITDIVATISVTPGFDADNEYVFHTAVIAYWFPADYTLQALSEGLYGPRIFDEPPIDLTLAGADGKYWQEHGYKLLDANTPLRSIVPVFEGPIRFVPIVINRILTEILDQMARDLANAAQTTATTADGKADANKILIDALTAASGITEAEAVALIADWAEQGNTDAIPADKLTNAPAGGLDEGEVDARIASELPTATTTQAGANTGTSRLAWTVQRLRQLVGAYAPNMSNALAIAGTSTARAIWSSLRVRQAINAVVPRVYRAGNTDTIADAKLPTTIARTSAVRTDTEINSLISAGDAASVDGYSIWVGTQAELDAITTKDASTLYHVTS